MSRIRSHADRAEGAAPVVSVRRARRGLMLVALALAAVGLALASCGAAGDAAPSASSSNSQSQSQSSTQQNQSQSSTQGGSQSTTQSNTQSSSQSGSGSLSQSSFSTDEGTVRTFAGTSGATLTVDTAGASRLLWSNDRGHRFRLDGAGTAVDSTAGAGEVALAAGSHRLTVHGAVWTIVIRPR